MDGYRERLSLDIKRRFGAEIELNAFDDASRPLDGSLPEGIYEVAEVVRSASKKPVQVHKWAYDHNNVSWVVKPDSSCGMEVCSPVLKGWLGLMQLCRVVERLGEDPRIRSDGRCSFHVHVDVSDLGDRELATILTWWVKCEPVFLDSVPFSRKRNQYCQLLAQSEAFERLEDGFMPHDGLIRKLGLFKYYTINTYHYFNAKRKTIEFRIMDSECCLDPYMCKNWIRLLLFFMERALQAGMPNPYHPGDRWSGYCWLDPKDVFEFLGLTSHYDLSPGLLQVKDWFLDRLHDNCDDGEEDSLFGIKARKPSVRQILDMVDCRGEERVDRSVYSETFRT